MAFLESQSGVIFWIHETFAVWTLVTRQFILTNLAELRDSAQGACVHLYRRGLLRLLSASDLQPIDQFLKQQVNLTKAYLCRPFVYLFCVQ